MRDELGRLVVSKRGPNGTPGGPPFVVRYNDFSRLWEIRDCLWQLVTRFPTEYEAVVWVETLLEASAVVRGRSVRGIN